MRWHRNAFLKRFRKRRRRRRRKKSQKSQNEAAIGSEEALPSEASLFIELARLMGKG